VLVFYLAPHDNRKVDARHVRSVEEPVKDSMKKANPQQVGMAVLEGLSESIRALPSDGSFHSPTF
jgi:hypothetical protein